MLEANSWKTAFILCAFCLVAAISSPAQTFKTLYSFCSQADCTDGAAPYAPLVQGTDGNLYGTTTEYGANRSGGTVFKITTGGELTTLYSFCDTDGCWLNGATPLGPLVLATNGDFYGTTSAGGTHAPAYYAGGTVFKITSNGSLTMLYDFCAQTKCTDGENPLSDLVQATNGNLYGTTQVGGTNSDNCSLGAYGCGTILEITPGGKLTTLYSFCAQSGCPDGQFPGAGLIQATNGDLYGTTPGGGDYGYGTVFKITPGGALTTLCSFCSGGGYPYCMDGAVPGDYTYYGNGSGAGLVQGTDGNFYGTTASGGNCGYGTVFKVTPTGKLTTLHSFGVPATINCTYGADGVGPNPGLIQATDGNLYGTTLGANNGGLSGTVFKITPGGTLTTLYSFCSLPNCADGAFPTSLVQATNGNLYGTTYEGGANGLFDGTVFSLSVGLKPFVETNPTSGEAGTKVTILGNNLTDTTSVTFNGKAATFTVKSSTEITTTVPSDATTGFAKVARPTGTLTSNVEFRVP